MQYTFNDAEIFRHEERRQAREEAIRKMEDAASQNHLQFLSSHLLSTSSCNGDVSHDEYSDLTFHSISRKLPRGMHAPPGTQ